MKQPRHVVCWRMCGLATLSLALMGSTRSGAAAAEVEVLHYWTSSGEYKSVEALKQMLAPAGVVWKDFVVQGAGGVAAGSALATRVDKGKPPTSAQIKGPMIQEWGRKGVLANLDDVATEGDWDVRLPRAIAAHMKVDGHWAAVPVNIHRVNWLWINKELLRKVGGRVPETWDQFFALAERFRQAGVLPLAHGSQPWQNINSFEVVVLGVGGPDLFRRAFVNKDPSAWRSPDMARALETFRRLKTYTDRESAGRDWNVATALVIQGRAAMQIMGDWAKGEFVAAGMTPGQDVLCTAAPGTWRAFIYNVDSFAMFQMHDPQSIAAQKTLAKTIMSPAFQEAFNLRKGSMPAIQGASLAAFDGCAKESRGYFVASALANSLVPSFANSMAQPEAVLAAVQAVIHRYWEDDAYGTESAQLAVAELIGARSK